MNAPLDLHRGEAARLAALERLGAVRFEADRVLQELVDDAREAFGTELCMANLIASDVQYFTAWSGELPPELAEARQDPRERSMCRYVVETEDSFVVEDLLATERFKDQHFRVRYGVRFYAGTPLITAEGHAIGSLCLLDTRPREFGEDRLILLRTFAKAVVGRLEALGAAAHEREAKESERQYRRNVFELANDAILIYGSETGRILDANRRACEMYGIPQKTLVGKKVAELSSEREVEEEHTREVLRRGSDRGFETVHRRADGTRMQVSINSSATEYGGQRAILSINRDVTGRRQAEEEIRRSQARNKAILDASPDLMFLFNRDGELLDFRAASKEAQLYVPAEGIVGRKLGDMMSAEVAENALRLIVRALDTGELQVYEYRLRMQDGPRDFEARLIKSGTNEVLSIVRDVTERKRTEEALRLSEKSLAQAQRIAHIGNWEHDLGENRTHWSDEMYRIFGFAPRSLVPSYRVFMLFVHPDDKERVRRSVRGALRGGEPEDVEYRIVRPDGEVRFVHTRYEAVHDGAGRPTKFLGTLQDVTHSKQVEQKLREAEETYRLLVEQIPAVAYIDRADVPDAVSYTSPRIEALLGYTPEEWLGGRLWIERLHPDDREWVLREDTRARAAEEPFGEEYRLIARDGRVVWVRDESALLRDEAGRPLLWQGILLDITERKQAEEALKESEARYRRLVESSPEAIAVHDGQRVLYANPAAAKLFGAGDPSWLIGREVIGFVHPDDRGVVTSRVRAALEEGEGTPLLEERYLRLDGGVVDAEVAGEPITYAGKPAVQVVLRDVTGRKRMEEELRHRATHDPLTGLPNRTLFMDRLGYALSREKREKGQVAVLFLDVDNLKLVNDTLGHKAGDRLLIAVTGRLRACLRPADTVARLSGDEFAILPEDVKGVSGAARVAERIAEALRAPFTLEERETFVTASIGIALSGSAPGSTGGSARDTAPDRAETLLRQADLAMYRAKSKGKAHHEVFDPAMNASAFQRLEVGNDLRRALERDEFRVCYQPKVRLHTTLQQRLRFSGGSAIVAASEAAKEEPRVVGMEALVRWEHPERGLLSPEKFIPVAEESGLIVPIGRKVLEEACRQARAWQERYATEEPLAMCVNISAKQFQHPKLAQDVARVLQQTGLDPRCLHLEITESDVMEDVHSTLDTLRKLENLGVQLAVDDFGTGYSSLSYLKRFPVGFLKIDRSFVEPLGEDPEDAVIVSGIISLAHTLGMQVVAEGVETARQLAYLQGLGCDMAQGNYFSEPLPVESASALLARHLSTNLQDDG